MSDQARHIIEPPPAGELLALVANFLSEEISPLIADEKLRFRVRVAANLLQIARREYEGIDELKPDANGYLVTDEIIASAGSLQNLTADLLAGRRSVTQPKVFTMLQRLVEAKLRIASPRRNQT